MGRILVLFTVLLGQLCASAEPIPTQITCSSTLEGEELGGKFESAATFEPHTPLLHSKIDITLTGKPTKTTQETYLATGSVCGIKLDFKKECSWREEANPKFGYGYTFKCSTDITAGEFYCDETCLSGKPGGATFSCEGPKVDKKFSGAGLVFSQCTYQPGTPE